MNLNHHLQEDRKKRYIAKLDLVKQYRDDLKFWNAVYDENCFTDERKTKEATDNIAVINKAIEQLKADTMAMRIQFFSREELAEMKKEYENYLQRIVKD